MEDLAPILEAVNAIFEMLKSAAIFMFTTPYLRWAFIIPLAAGLINTVMRILRRRG